jgi:hypothetical protein
VNARHEAGDGKGTAVERLTKLTTAFDKAGEEARGG